jgi:hypothetical protein
VRKTGQACSEMELRLACRVELARGASHISSALSAASTAAAVAEVLEHFIADRGFDMFHEFRMLLAQDLMRRQCPAGARAVEGYVCARVPAVACPRHRGKARA